MSALHQFDLRLEYYLLLEWPEGKLLKPSLRMLMSVCVHIVEFDRPYGDGSIEPALG
jgi:hypothetical protein